MRGSAAPALEDVNRRRAQLWLLSLLLGLTLPAVLLALRDVPDEVTWLLGTPAVRVCLLLLLVALCGYIAEREHSLRGLTGLLIEERTNTAVLVAQLGELDLLARAGHAMNASLELDRVLGIILQSACELLGACGGAIALPTPGADGELEVVAHTGEAVASPAAVVVPLVSRDERVGELHLAVADDDAFSDLQLRSVALFAETAAAAIVNARVHSATSASVATLTELERLKDEFLTLVTHELRTPLTSVIGLAQTIQRGAGRLSPEKVNELSGLVVSQGWRLDRLVDDLLRTRRLQGSAASSEADAAAFGTVDVGWVVRGTVAGLVASSPDHTVELDLPDALVLRVLDEDALARIVGNLVGNALQYTPSGSVVRVSVDGGAADRVVVVVEDDGPGIPPAEWEQVFDKFRRGEGRSSGGGLGLGLYLVRALAAAHGGSAVVGASASGGCRVTVELASADRLSRGAQPRLTASGGSPGPPSRPRRATACGVARPRRARRSRGRWGGAGPSSGAPDPGHDPVDGSGDAAGVRGGGAGWLSGAAGSTAGSFGAGLRHSHPPPGPPLRPDASTASWPGPTAPAAAPGCARRSGAPAGPPPRPAPFRGGSGDPWGAGRGSGVDPGVPAGRVRPGRAVRPDPRRPPRLRLEAWPVRRDVAPVARPCRRARCAAPAGRRPG